MVTIPICFTCKHYVDDATPVARCAAFPDGIPEEIFWGTNNHDEEYPGDHGLRYESTLERDQK